MASQAVGSATAWGPDQARADAATRSIFALLDKKSPIDPLGDEGLMLPVVPVQAGAGAAAAAAATAAAAAPASVSIVVAADAAAPLPPPPPPAAAAAIVFKDVTFSYPSRPGNPVLQNFSLTIPAGESIGIVGASGSGKSTIVALLLRWYDPCSGEIT